VATHFSRLLRHAWVTVGLFLFPGHHTGIIVTQLVKKFPDFYGPRKFISLSTKIRHFMLSRQLNPVTCYFSKTYF